MFFSEKMPHAWQLSWQSTKLHLTGNKAGLLHKYIVDSKAIMKQLSFLIGTCMLHQSQVQFRAPRSQNPVLTVRGLGSMRDIIFPGVRKHFCLFSVVGKLIARQYRSDRNWRAQRRGLLLWYQHWGHSFVGYVQVRNCLCSKKPNQQNFYIFLHTFGKFAIMYF